MSEDAYLAAAVEEAKAALARAEAQLAAAQQAQRSAQQVERDVRAAEELQRITDMQDEDFVAANPGHDVRPYILPFGREYGRWNPRDVENMVFGKEWLARTTAIICRRTDEPRTAPSRLIFTSGTLVSERDKIGQRFTALHDQTGSRLGEYQIVGLVIYDNEGNVARTVGDVPDRKLSQNTYK